MKIGIFDSGLGGLVILRALKKSLPKYDYLYLGDTKHLPYGDKNQTQIFNLTRRAVEYLFSQDCLLVIVACNTASSQALRRLQQEWLPRSRYSHRKILGVIRPTAESVGRGRQVGLIGTRRTVDSRAYVRELRNSGWHGRLKTKATPKLVPMIEAGRIDKQVLALYLKPLEPLDGLILACTHYGLLEKEIRDILGKRVQVISQNRLLPLKLKTYLKRHPEITQRLSKRAKTELRVTKSSPRYAELSRQWFGTARLSVIKY